MKRCFLLLLLIGLYHGADSQELIQYVQPMSGTASSTTQAALKHSEDGSEKNANTIPAVGLPFAMTQWTPQTRLTEQKCIPPYFYKDSLFSGFRATHWLSGSCTQDYGSFTIMPVVHSLQTVPANYAIPFSHENEISSPAFYSLTTNNLETRVSATLRCGIIEFTMLQDDSLYILITPNSNQNKGFAKINRTTREIVGYNPVHRIYQGWGEAAGFNGWFYIQTDRDFTVSGSFDKTGQYGADSIQTGKRQGGGVYLGYYLRKGERLTLRAGTSFTSLEGAKKNFESEIADKSFETVLSTATTRWEHELSAFDVKGHDEREKRIFYTAVYHTMQHPRLYTDVDGRYPRFSGNYENMQIAEGDYYDDFSMWDIYRAQIPLFEIMQPEKVRSWVQSLVHKATQGGWLPIFPCWNSYTAAMIGDHSISVIASAIVKGIYNTDLEIAYQLMRKNAFEIPPNFTDYKNGMGRRALQSYLDNGFVPVEDSVQEAFHKKEQVSRTLEYAYNDYALYKVAQQLNKKDDSESLRNRAFNYQHVFDRQVKMVRGRHSNGQWANSFDPDKREYYITEGTPRQYTFYVPHDIPGLAQLMGGPNELESSLDLLFEKEEYWHGNEPGHQIPFLYNYTSAPWKAQQQVREILKHEYSDGPGGLSGNDDAGQMSAWYVFAALGFYPVNPMAGEYMLVTPLFDSINLRLDDQTFKIRTYKETDDAIYIQSVRWNGKKYKKNFITYAQLREGGLLELWLSNKPSSWGADPGSRSKGLK